MVNLRQRAPQSKVIKRTSSRNTSDNSSTVNKKYKEEIVKIDSESESGSIEEDIALEESEGETDDLLDGYVVSSSSSSLSSEDNSVSIGSDSEGSEDDKEIRRIIEKTEAETRNIPLTARQRAKLEGGTVDFAESESNLASTALTDEQALKKSEKSRRRKLQRDAKIEETKRATIDRLLQKQKKTPVNEEEADNTATIDNDSTDNFKDPATLESGYMRFIDNNTGTILKFPDDATFEAAISDLTRLPKICTETSCQVCSHGQGKYVHPRSGKRFCSVNCFKLIN